MAESRNVKYLIVDTGPFIRNAPIKDIGENVYTLRDVLSEIKDKDTRQRLQVLPYDLKFKEPSNEAIRYVTDFSKKTGDYPSLSAVDIRVMGLVYQLEKEHVGSEHIKTSPERNITWNATKSNLENPTQIAGFYLKKNNSSKATSRTTSECISESSSCNHDNTEPANVLTEQNQDANISRQTSDSTTQIHVSDNISNQNDDSETQTSIFKSGKCEHQVDMSISGLEENKTVQLSVGELYRTLNDGDTLTADQLEEQSDEEEGEEEEEDEEDDDDDDDDDDDGGWITPSNIKEVKMTMGGRDSELADVMVGCMTTDFAMQNVLIQMGLNVVSVDGLLIKKAKSYVLRCYGCYKITKNIMKEFCFHCGNKTLQKVSMTVADDGSIHYFLSKRKQVTTRGMKYSLPTPKGGKHAVNPMLVEDQPMPHQRQARRGKVKYDALDPDFVAQTSPFAPIDTHSRAAQLGIKGSRDNNFRSKRNPNENKKVYGRRK